MSSERYPTTRPRRQFAAIAGVAAAPLVLGATLPIGSLDSEQKLCAMRGIFGVPCPFCGASRAFNEFGHGSAEWIHSYNGFWVIVSIATLCLSVLALIASWHSPRSEAFLEGRLDRLRRRPGAVLLILIVLAVPGWVWAISNRATIV